MPHAPPVRRARARRALASAALLSALVTSCTAAESDGARSNEPASTSGPSITTATTGPSTAPATSTAPSVERCAIATGCAVPRQPTTFEVEPLPDGWTIADATAEERGPTEAADTIVRVLTTPAGDRVWISLLRDSQSMPPDDQGTTTSLVGDRTAVVSTTPMRNYPSDVVETMVVLRLSDELLVMARGQKVPPDDVVAVVRSLVIA